MTDGTATARDAVRYLLTSPILDDRCRPMLAGDEPDWLALLAETDAMSNGQRLLVSIASDLWHGGGGTVGVAELAGGLDRTSFESVVIALRLYRGEDAAAPRLALREAA